MNFIASSVIWMHLFKINLFTLVIFLFPVKYFRDWSLNEVPVKSIVVNSGNSNEKKDE
jgi:hypothetical protein